MIRNSTLFAVALVVLVAAGGCEPPGPAERKAPVLELSSLEGKKQTVPSADARATMLVFWYSSCEYCQAEAPQIQRLYDKFSSQGLAVQAVNVHDRPPVAKRFMAERGLNYPVLLDPHQRAAEAYRVVGVPRIVLVDNAGYIVYEEYSVPDDAHVREVLGIR